MRDAKIDVMKGAMIDAKGGMKDATREKTRDATKGRTTDAKSGMKDATRGKMRDATKGRTLSGIVSGMKDAIKEKKRDATNGKMTGAKSVMRDVTKSRIKDKTKEQIRNKIKDKLSPKNMFHPLKNQKMQGKLNSSLQKGNKDHQLKDQGHPKKGVSLLKRNSNLKFQPRDQYLLLKRQESLDKDLLLLIEDLCQQQKVHPQGKEANLLLERDLL